MRLISRRRRSGPDPFLAWKVGIFVLAAGMWIAGVIAGQAWLTGAALAVLLVGLLLRFVRRGEPGE